MTWRSPRTAIAVLVFVGYLAVSRSVGNLYPFSTYSMYAEGGRGRPSRIAVRDGHGALTDPDHWTRWACPTLVAFDRATCPESTPATTIPYLDRDAEQYVRAHPGRETDPGAEDVYVVRHVWWFSAGDGPPREFDCPVCTCRAVPR